MALSLQTMSSITMERGQREYLHVERKQTPHGRASDPGTGGLVGAKASAGIAIAS